MENATLLTYPSTTALYFLPELNIREGADYLKYRHYIDIREELFYVFRVCLCDTVLSFHWSLVISWPLGSLVRDVFLCFFHFLIWCPGSHLVLYCIDSWYLPSSLLLPTPHVTTTACATFIYYGITDPSVIGRTYKIWRQRTMFNSVCSCSLEQQPPTTGSNWRTAFLNSNAFAKSGKERETPDTTAMQ